jgi:predicted TIM-barrel fold metal-dependent hydrolase
VLVDADSHLFEPPGMWAAHCDPAHRHLALDLVEDEIGHMWLVDGRANRLHLAEVHRPGDVGAMGRERERLRQGQPPERPYSELPPEYSDPAARLEALDGWGVDETVLFPNYGLLLERPLAHDLPATLANLRAWNRWAAIVATEGGGRLHPVAQLTLRDLDWLEAELATVSAAGIRLGMIPPALVDGKPLSHPDLDRAWAAFVDHGVTPVFHVAAFPHVFHDPWYEGDPDPVNPVLDSVFLWTPAALALADLAIHGTFDRHPDLRIGVMELSAGWFPTFLLMLDGGFDFHRRFNGEPLTQLAERPSTYLLRHVRVAAFAIEGPADLVASTGPGTFMYCSDWPHAEGLPQPADDYRRAVGDLDERDPAGADGIWHGNINFLLRR